jgi:uncharacterized protein YjbI with pentapeptide repeats
MANQKLLDLLTQSTTLFNLWRDEHPNIRIDFGNVGLGDADLSEANLNNVNLVKANLSEADLSKADLSRANLSEADLIRANLRRADLSGADLHSAILSEANLFKTSLSQADLGGAFLNNTDLRNADLSEADLSRAVLREADLSRANLGNAKLMNADLHRAVLREADLSGADLFEADLFEADLSGANLRHANLRHANLFLANLSGADLFEADLSGADLHRANLREANLREANLKNSILVETDLTGAILTRCSVYGASVWNVELEGATQDSLIITPKGEPTITIDNLKVAQFIYLLLDNQELRNVLNSVTERGVLLLGRFSDGGLEMLQSIAAELRKMKYLPMLFDFDRPDNRDYTETVKTLVGLSRFVIVDLSGPSVPQELYATVPHFKIPFVPIIEASRKPYSMAVDLLEYPWVVRPPITFTTTEELLEQLPTKVIAPAEEKHQGRQKLLDELFN